jgi:hypothetical protein
VSQTLRTTVPRSVAPRRDPGPDAGARLFVAYWGALVVIDLTDGTAAVAAMAALVSVCGVRRRVAVGLAVGGEGCLFLVGFLGHGHGELVLHGTGDAGRLLLLLAVAAATAALTPPPSRGDR